MRAIFLNEWPSDEVVLVDGDNFNHLKVVRVKIGEEVKLLDGKGKIGISIVTEISKKNILLKIVKLESIKSNNTFVNLGIVLPKKDAFESIVRIAVEMGVKEIYPLSGDFSQFELNDFYINERLGKIIESSLIQSNNPFKTKIVQMNSLENFLSDISTPLWIMDSKFKENKNSKLECISSSATILIGPEAGFSNSEYQLFEKITKNVFRFHFPLPIMTAPTATAASLSLFWSKQC